MDMFLRGLKIEGGALYGKRLFRSWVLIEAEDIAKVRTYGWRNPFLKVWTSKGNFVLGTLAEGYEEVVQYIEDHTAFAVSDTYAHKYIMVLYRLPVSQIVGYLFGRRRRKGKKRV